MGFFFFTHETHNHTQTQGYLRLTTKNQTCWFGHTCYLGYMRHEMERSLVGFVTYWFIYLCNWLFFLRWKYNFVMDTESPPGSLWAESLTCEKGRGKESLALPFDGSFVSIASWNCVKALTKELVHWAPRAILVPSSLSCSFCLRPNSLELA